MQSWPAIAWLDRPSAISDSTLRGHRPAPGRRPGGGRVAVDGFFGWPLAGVAR
jgi:hypothetical protein